MQLSTPNGAKLQSFLVKERDRLGLRQKAVYESIGVNKATYYRWEAGSPIPSDKLERLSELGFDVTYVVTGKRAQVDHAALQDCLEIIEEALQETGKTLTPQQKAKVLTVLYEEYIDDADNLTPERVARHLRLVA